MALSHMAPSAQARDLLHLHDPSDLGTHTRQSSQRQSSESCWIIILQTHPELSSPKVLTQSLAVRKTMSLSTLACSCMHQLPCTKITWPCCSAREGAQGGRSQQLCQQALALGLHTCPGLVRLPLDGLHPHRAA